MRTTPLVIFGFAVVLLSGAEVASAFISANTIDERATYKKDGRLLRVSGPIRCTRGERVSIRSPSPAGDRSPRAESVEGPLHGQGPAVGGYGARSPRDPLRERPRPCLRRRARAPDLASPTPQMVRARKRGPQPRSRPDDRRGGRVLHGQQHR